MGASQEGEEVFVNERGHLSQAPKARISLSLNSLRDGVRVGKSHPGLFPSLPKRQLTLHIQVVLAEMKWTPHDGDFMGMGLRLKHANETLVVLRP